MCVWESRESDEKAIISRTSAAEALCQEREGNLFTAMVSMTGREL
jgi:hypothetical protein